jgi:uncharacterized delta-60 repeat protein
VSSSFRFVTPFLARPHKTARRSRAVRFQPWLEGLEPRTLLNAGQLDPSFGMNGIVRILPNFAPSTPVAALQPNGKIILAGSLGGTDITLVRLNADGSLDSTFSNGGVAPSMRGFADAVAVQPDGKILVAGTISANATTFDVLRFDPDGTLDRAFGTNGVATPYNAQIATARATALVVRPDGRIIVAGQVNPQSGLIITADLEIVGLEADGMVDPNFASTNDNDQLGPAGTLALAPDGTIVVAANGLFRLLPDGSRDMAFGSNGSVSPTWPVLAVQPDGRIVASNGTQLIRYNANGTPDVTFGSQGTVLTNFPDPNLTANAILVQPDDRIVVVASGTHTIDLARYNPNGTLDTTFGTDGEISTPLPRAQSLALSSALLQADRKIVVGGSVQDPFTFASTWLAVRSLGDTPSGADSQRFVTQLYLDLLQRSVDAGGLAFWSGLIDSGQATNAQVVQMLEGSTEYHQRMIEQVYSDYLHRAVDAGGLSAWNAFLNSGGTIDQMRALIIGSAEYFNLNGGTNDAFVQAVYHDVLYRGIDSGGQQGWDQVLNNGADRGAVAGAILRTTEGSDDEVQGLYFWLLHRTSDPAGLQSFTSDLQQGTPVEQIVAILAGSPEYAATRT